SISITILEVCTTYASAARKTTMFSKQDAKSRPTRRVVLFNLLTRRIAPRPSKRSNKASFESGGNRRANKGDLTAFSWSWLIARFIFRFSYRIPLGISLPTSDLLFTWRTRGEDRKIDFGHVNAAVNASHFAFLVTNPTTITRRSRLSVCFGLH